MGSGGVPARSRNFSNRASMESRAAGSVGLTQWRLTPESADRLRSASIAYAVTTTITGYGPPLAMSRIRCATPHPLVSGRRISSSILSGRSILAVRRAAWPVRATDTR